MKQPRNRGKFSSTYSEPRGKPIAFRLPASLDADVRRAAGNDVNKWIKELIVEKLRSSTSKENVGSSHPA